MSGGTRSFELGRRLVDMGHSVSMVTSIRDTTNLRGWQVTEEAGMKVHWLPVRYSNHMGFMARIKSFIAFASAASIRASRIPANVIFASSTPLTIALPAIASKHVQGRPIVFEVRDSWPTVPIELGYLRHPAMRAAARGLEYVAYAASSHVVALSPAMREDVIGRGYPPDRVSVIPNGCDLELMPSGNGKRIERKYAWVKERPLLVYVGTIGRMNGVRYLIELADALQSFGNPFTIAIVGDGSEREAVTELARTKGVLDKSVYIIGAIPKTQVPDWLSLAEAAFMTLDGPPSVAKYAVQNKFFDALAAGLPILSNVEGYASEIGTKAGATLLLDMNPRTAAEVLTSRWNSGWFESARDASTRLARGTFSRDTQAKELESILTRVTESPRGRP